MDIWKYFLAVLKKTAECWAGPPVPEIANVAGILAAQNDMKVKAKSFSLTIESVVPRRRSRNDAGEGPSARLVEKVVGFIAMKNKTEFDIKEDVSVKMLVKEKSE